MSVSGSGLMAWTLRVVLALVLSVSLAACGGSGGGQQGGQGGGVEVDPEGTAPIQATISGGSSAGFYRVLAESINSIIRDEYPGSSIAYEPGSPVGALAQVAEGRIQFGAAISPVEEKAAIEGIGPFEETGSLDGQFLGVTRVYETQRMHSVMTQSFAEEHGIETFEDIAEKKPPLRIAINQQGNYQNVRAAEEIFKAYGFTFDDIAEWGGEIFFQASGDGINLLADRRADMYFNGTFIPDSRLADISRSLEMVWVPMDEEKLQQVADDLGFLTGPVEPGEYEFITEEQQTIYMQSDIVSNADVPAQQVYQFVKALDENQDRMKEIHPSMADFSPELMIKVQDQIPLHPGAEQYYKEKGLID